MTCSFKCEIKLYGFHLTLFTLSGTLYIVFNFGFYLYQVNKWPQNFLSNVKLLGFTSIILCYMPLSSDVTNFQQKRDRLRHEAAVEWTTFSFS